jgi:hypothetical protein
MTPDKYNADMLVPLALNSGRYISQLDVLLGHLAFFKQFTHAFPSVHGSDKQRLSEVAFQKNISTQK